MTGLRNGFFLSASSASWLKMDEDERFPLAGRALATAEGGVSVAGAAREAYVRLEKERM